MDSEVTQVHAAQVLDDGDLSLLEAASVVLRRRRLVLVSTFLGTLFALMGALRSELVYTATASFLPRGESQEGLSGAANLARQSGFATLRLGDAEQSPEFYQDLLRSREILDGAVKSSLEVFTTSGVTHVGLAERFLIEGETVEERNALTRRHLAENVISVSVAAGTGVVTLRVRTDQAELSAAIGRRLLDLISEFDRETRQSKASTERSFAGERLEQLGAELATAEDSLKTFLVENRQFANSPQLVFEHDRRQRQVAMRQELVTAMAQAFEQARIEEVRNRAVFTVIDQPEPPALPDPRGRLLKLVLGLLLGLMVGLGLAFILEFGERAKNQESKAFVEFRQVLKAAKGDLIGLRRSSRPAASSTDSNA